jgi:hypothetical protein
MRAESEAGGDRDVFAQSWELEMTGSASMTEAEYYEDVFASAGFAKARVQAALREVGTHDYQAVVALLHARDSAHGAGGAAQRVSALDNAERSD